MRQLLQNMKSGETSVVDVPIPTTKPGFLLVKNSASLVSAGTERMLVEFAEKNLLEKARSRPDLLKQIIDKARREGIIPTIEAAFNRLDQPMTLGYSSAGVVVELGADVRGFKAGDRVACAGGGFAVHAEYVLVPQNLAAHVPESLDLEQACFATLGAIALHGFRLAAPQIGDRVAIIGLGLLGLLATGIAKAAGCQVFGFDISPGRVALAESMGFTAVVRSAAEESGRAFTNGLGFDHVLICADAKSNDPIELAGVLARDRANVVAVGAVGLDIPRKVYYEKEINFIVSRSYGPGRYDPAYEEGGVDYPAGYIRWTEGRNLQALVDMMASGRLDVRPLITHRFPINDAPAAYELITGKGAEPFLAVLLTYPEQATGDTPRKVNIPAPTQYLVDAAIRVGVLGAGNYANATFLPVIQKAGGASLVGIASAAGAHAQAAAQKFGFKYASSEDKQILADQEINAVVILTRHDLHTRQTIEALQAGKHVYCEKPAAVNLDQLNELRDTLQQGGLPVFTVGFNRRFAPLAMQMKEFFETSSEPKMMHYRVNAGPLPLTHWLHDPVSGGGRMIGEGCHFVDLMTWLNGSLPVSATIQALPDGGQYREDNLILTLKFENGSLGILEYLANGDKAAPKEYLHVSAGGRMAELDDFRRLETWNGGSRKVSQGGIRQDKGHYGAWVAFLKSVKTGIPAIPFTDIITEAEITIRAVEQLRSGVR